VLHKRNPVEILKHCGRC